MIKRRAIEDRLEYLPTDGRFLWRDGPHKGQLAGTIQHNGYRAIMLDRKLLLEHRMAWVMEYGSWPKGSLDHINGDKADNRIENLRPANKSQNAANAKCYANSECGLKGVKQVGKASWMARIAVNKKRLYLGRFDSPEEAHAAYVEAANKHHGEFARTE